MYDDILIPTDGSPGAARAEEHAIDLAAENDARVHALYVVAGGARTDAWADVVGVPAGEAVASRPQESVLRERGEAAVDAISERAEDRGVECVTALLDGRPHERIVEYAEQNDVDLIVMGTHGRSGLRRFILGSVTEAVLRGSSIPVLSVTHDGVAKVDDVEAAKAAARQALEAKGHDAVTFPEEPYRQRSSWVVRAHSSDQTFNVHVSVTGETSVARIRST